MTRALSIRRVLADAPPEGMTSKEIRDALGMEPCAEMTTRVSAACLIMRGQLNQPVERIELAAKGARNGRAQVRWRLTNGLERNET